MKRWVLYIVLFLVTVSNIVLLWMICPYVLEKYHFLTQAIIPSDIKIFVTYYKPHRIPVKGKMLQPIQVGRAIEREPFVGGTLSEESIDWLHQHTIGDNTGDNISNKNRSFDVLTAYYWVWKHYKEIGNPKYIGFMAHRKILVLGEPGHLGMNLYAPDYGFDKEALTDILKKHLVITYEWRSYYKTDLVSIYESYFHEHYIEDLTAMMEIIHQDYPEMEDVMAEVLNNVGKPYSIWNYWVMDRELAFDYFEKLFHIMFKVENERGAEIAQYDLRQRRVFGYLAERFFAIWLEYQVRTNGIQPFVATVQFL